MPNIPAHERGDRLNPARSSRTYWVLTSLRREVEKVINDHLSRSLNEVLVDYGCGNMPYRSLFASCVKSYIGVDLPGNDLADLVTNSIDAIPMPDHSADIVLSTQVLEHVGDPAAYLDEVRRVLAVDGHLVLSTHGHWKYHPDPRDLWRWTSEGLKQLVSSRRLTVTSLSGILGPAATGLQLWQDAVIPHLRPTFCRLFTGAMQRAIQFADSRSPASVRDRDACVYLLVAKKGEGP